MRITSMLNLSCCWLVVTPSLTTPPTPPSVHRPTRAPPPVRRRPARRARHPHRRDHDDRDHRHHNGDNNRDNNRDHGKHNRHDHIDRAGQLRDRRALVLGGLPRRHHVRVRWPRRLTYYCPTEYCDSAYWNTLTSDDAIPGRDPYTLTAPPSGSTCISTTTSSRSSRFSVMARWSL